jgi:hypothetical protein
MDSAIGAPVLNRHGETVGMATWSSPNDRAVNLGLSYTEILSALAESDRKVKDRLAMPLSNSRPRLRYEVAVCRATNAR